MRRVSASWHDDEGAILIFVLIVLLVIGLITGALFGSAGANQRNTPLVRAHLSNVYAADAGIDAGLQRIRRSTNYCATANNPSPDITYSVLADQRDVTVHCAVISTAGSVVGAAGYAAVVTGGSQSVVSTSTTQGASQKIIDGPVFLSGKTDLKQALTIHGGDIDNLCNSAVQPAAADLKFDIGYSWTPCQSTRPPVDHVLPPEPCAASPSTCSPSVTGYDVLGSSCRIFLPGTYTSAPVLLSGGLNYFASGLYHFANVGPITVKQSAAVGGAQVSPPATTPSCTRADPTVATITTPLLPNNVSSRISGYGATFVFSGDSYFDMDTGGSLEIFPRLPATGTTPTWTPRLSVVALDTNTGNSGWPTSSRAGDILQPKSGSTPAETVNGLYYTPGASLTVSATQDAVARFLDGLVVNSLTIAESASAISLQVSIRRVASTRRVRIVSTAAAAGGEKAVTSVAIVDVSTATGTPVTVLSWRSSAPDF
jgi:Tfp pilus assembly protein PilX